MKPKNTRQKIAIHQYHYSASLGDGVTDHMVFIRDSLHRAGISGEMYATEIKDSAQGRVRPFLASEIWDCDLLLIHHSHGNPQLGPLLKIEVPKALIYHNVTPPHYFRHDPYIAKLCKMGRDQLHIFRSHTVANFADSRFNAVELTDLRFSRSDILPLLDVEKMLSTPPPSGKRDGQTLFLFVGRMAPHKNQAMILRVFFHLRRFIRQNCRLVFVGTQDPIYGNYVRLLRNQLDLKQSVEFSGHVSAQKLRQYYESADAFICLSEHEGFCRPLVEAMACDVPVFFRPISAIPETMGNAGVELLSSRPEEQAAAIATVLENKEAIATIQESQRNRLRQLAQIQNPTMVGEILVGLVQRLRSSPGDN